MRALAVREIVEDQKGNVWFGTEGGVSKYDGKTFTNFQRKQGLASDGIQCILEDSEGRIWLGGVFGLFRYNGKSIVSVGKDGPWQ